MPAPPPVSLRERVRLTLGYLEAAPRVFKLVDDSSRAFALSLVAVLVGQSALPAAMAWVGKLIIDGVVLSARTGLAADRARVLHLVLLELGLVTAQLVLARGQMLLRELLRTSLGNHVNTLILEKAATLELRHFEDAAFYDKMQNARREASTRPLQLVLELFNAGQHALMIASFSVLLWSLSRWSVGVIVAASLPAFVAEARLSGEAFRLNTWRAPDARRHNYLEWILTRDSHVKEVKLLGLAPLVLARYRALFARFYAEDLRLAVKRTLSGLLFGALSLLAFYAAYAAMAVRAAGAEISLGDLALYLSLFRLGQSSFQALLGSVASLYESGLFVSNLFAFLDLESRERPRVSPARTLPRGAAQAIELIGVEFRYPGRAEASAEAAANAEASVEGEVREDSAFALRGLTLRIEPGETLALVGDNGAGKSTLIKLLLRLYEPTAGQILYGGVDVRDLEPQDLRSRVGVLFQDFVRYQFSALENVGLGDTTALDDRARIERAVDQGGARPVIDALPHGLDTMLGGWFEEGHELSGGQWQKIALARAFLRDAELLILDEPSAALDAEAEADLFLRMKQLAAGRTTLLISHRFSTVRSADRIAVIQHGRIEELGTHDELVKKGGRYAHLFALQAAGYRH